MARQIANVNLPKDLIRVGTPAKEDIESDTAPPDLASKLVVPANEDAIRGAMTMAIWAVPRIEPWLDILTASLSHDRKRLRERAESRDDIPAVLLGLQHLYSHEETREKLFSVLEEPDCCINRGMLL